MRRQVCAVCGDCSVGRVYKDAGPADAAGSAGRQRKTGGGIGTVAPTEMESQAWMDVEAPRRGRGQAGKAGNGLPVGFAYGCVLGRHTSPRYSEVGRRIVRNRKERRRCLPGVGFFVKATGSCTGITVGRWVNWDLLDLGDHRSKVCGEGRGKRAGLAREGRIYTRGGDPNQSTISHRGGRRDRGALTRLRQ